MRHLLSIFLALSFGSQVFAANEALKVGKYLDIPTDKYYFPILGHLAEPLQYSAVGEKCALGMYTSTSDNNIAYGGVLQLIGSNKTGDQYLVRFQPRMFAQGSNVFSICPAGALYFVDKKDLLKLQSAMTEKDRKEHEQIKKTDSIVAETNKILDDFVKVNGKLQARGDEDFLHYDCDLARSETLACKKLYDGSKVVSSRAATKKIWWFKEGTRMYKTLEIWGASPSVENAK